VRTFPWLQIASLIWSRIASKNMAWQELEAWFLLGNINGLDIWSTLLYRKEIFLHAYRDKELEKYEKQFTILGYKILMHRFDFKK
jgi:hypothetical protein